MIGPFKVDLAADFVEFGAFMDEVSTLIETSNRTSQARLSFADSVLKLINQGRGVRIDHPSASATGKLVVSLEITDELRGLVTAFRAGN